MIEDASGSEPRNDSDSAQERDKNPLLAIWQQTSPIVALIGHRVVAVEPGSARVELDVRDAHCNRGGGVHGGIYCVLMDTVGGFAGIHTTNREEMKTFITLTLTTNFLGQPRGKTMIATGRLRAGGRSTFFSDMEIHDEVGNLLATGSGTFKYRAMKPEPSL